MNRTRIKYFYVNKRFINSEQTFNSPPMVFRLIYFISESERQTNNRRNVETLYKFLRGLGCGVLRPYVSATCDMKNQFSFMVLWNLTLNYNYGTYYCNTFLFEFLYMLVIMSLLTCTPRYSKQIVVPARLC